MSKPSCRRFWSSPSPRPRRPRRSPRRSSTSQGTARTYYLFVPDSAKGSRRRSSSCCMARAATARSWSSTGSRWPRRKASSSPALTRSSATGGACATMGRCLLRHVIEAVQTDYAVDRRAMYVFGHSAGAIHGISMGVLESEYFAAVAVHAGAVSPSVVPLHRAGAHGRSRLRSGSAPTTRHFQSSRCARASSCSSGRSSRSSSPRSRGTRTTTTAARRRSTKPPGRSCRARRLEKDPQYQDYVNRAVTTIMKLFSPRHHHSRRVAHEETRCRAGRAVSGRGAGWTVHARRAGGSRAAAGRGQAAAHDRDPRLHAQGRLLLAAREEQSRRSSSISRARTPTPKR